MNRNEQEVQHHDVGLLSSSCLRLYQKGPSGPKVILPDRRTDGRTDGRTGGLTDGRTTGLRELDNERVNAQIQISVDLAIQKLLFFLDFQTKIFTVQQNLFALIGRYEKPHQTQLKSARQNFLAINKSNIVNSKLGFYFNPLLGVSILSVFPICNSRRLIFTRSRLTQRSISMKVFQKSMVLGLNLE